MSRCGRRPSWPRRWCHVAEARPGTHLRRRRRHLRLYRPGHGPWLGGLLVPLALLLLTLGLWLPPRSASQAAGPHAAGSVPYLRRRMLENRWGILLVPVTLLGLTVFGVHPWTVAAILAAWSPRCGGRSRRGPGPGRAGRLRGPGLHDRVELAVAAAGLERAQPCCTARVLVSSPQTAMLAGAEASAFLAFAAWLVPRTIGAHARTALAPGRIPELAGRVQRLTETRGQAVDAAAAELRRIERDLHDGAQARLVALGMNLRAVERMLPGQPAGRAGPGRRGPGDLVAGPERPARPGPRHLPAGAGRPRPRPRGAGPRPGHAAAGGPGHQPARPADRAGRVRLLLRGRRGPGQRGTALRRAPGAHPHAARRRAYCGSRWPTTASGGADPARGTGLQGVERRLGTFDGIMAVSSPPGGPTMIAMEVPCVLSSPKTSSS